METTYFWLQQKEENKERQIETIRGTVNPADWMTKHLHGKRLKNVVQLLSIKHISGRPSSAPKLTLNNEYISHASRSYRRASRTLGCHITFARVLDTLTVWWATRDIAEELPFPTSTRSSCS